MTPPLLLNAMRDHLIDENVVRLPRIAGESPPMWLEPQDGAPAPADKQGTEDGTVVLSAFLTGGIPSRPYESFMRTDVVDVWLRAANAKDIFTTEEQVRGALIDQRAWTMGGLEIIESLQWRPLQRLGSDRQGFTFVCAFTFQRFA